MVLFCKLDYSTYFYYQIITFESSFINRIVLIKNYSKAKSSAQVRT